MIVLSAMGFITEVIPMKHLKIDIQDGLNSQTIQLGTYDKQQLEESYTNDKLYIFCLLQTLWFILTIIWLMCDLLIGFVCSAMGVVGIIVM